MCNPHKPFYSLNQYYRDRFGGKVYKLSLNGGMTCPNRDGTIDNRGCIFCSAGGSGDFASTAMIFANESGRNIPDYTFEEKKIIFSKFSLPKVLKRMSMKAEECIVTDEALDAIVRRYDNTTGIRDLEQAAEHLAAHALYEIEANQAKKVEYTVDMVKELLS